MNIFSGARRLAAVIAVLGAAIAFFSQLDGSNVILEYRVLGLDIPALRSDTCNVGTDKFEYADKRTQSGDDFKVRVCFAAQKADDGRMLIPYAKDEQNTYMNQTFSPDVREYVENYIATKFQLSTADYKEAESAIFKAKWVKRGSAVGAAMGWLIIFWIMVSITGWIVRGFMGVPSGTDHRPKAVEK